MVTRGRVGRLAAFAVVLATNAQAGLLDSPPPSFSDGVPGRIVYRLGPVHYTPGRVDTVVTCTNLGDQTANLAIEFFDDEDARGFLARGAAPAGGNVTFATSVEAGGERAVVVSDMPPVEHGKARVSATTAKLSCAARHRIRAADGSTKEAPVELVKKVAFD